MHSDTSCAEDFRDRAPLGVEVRDVSTLLRARHALSSNWFDVSGLELTIKDGVVTLWREGRAVVSSTGRGWLEVDGRRLQGERVGLFRQLARLPVGEGRVVEVERGGSEVHRSLRVMPDGVRLAVVERVTAGLPSRRGCRIDLVSGVIHTDVVLRCLVYFRAVLEREYRFDA